MDEQPIDPLNSYMTWLGSHARQSGRVHRQFLALRQAGLRQSADSIARQAQALTSRPVALFSPADLREFAAGDITRCLGDDYAVYAGRRCPRIPNGDLLLMSRVRSIQGRPGDFGQVSGILAEVDVPPDAWYLARGGQLPLSICLEIGLQPCGFLSAFLGTPLRYPDAEFFFRNLDGQARFNRRLDARGKTVQTRAELLETTFSGATIIQRFSFELRCDGEIFFQGRSAFGYFTPEMMENQLGLDGGKPSLPWLRRDGARRGRPGSVSLRELPQGRLRLVDQVELDPAGGLHQAGYAWARRANSPADWFYACHFYQDPVMPGSLGIEAVVQAMSASVLSGNPGASVSPALDQELRWKYRGQVLPKNKEMQLEAHFHPPVAAGPGKIVRADASLWADELRIYEMENLVLEIREVLPAEKEN